MNSTRLGAPLFRTASRGTCQDVTVFRDRADAGRRLAALLTGEPGAVVLGLPRGGVPVAYEVARALGAPLDVVVVRKLGVPGHAELAMGAVGEGGVVVVNDAVLRETRVSAEAFARVEWAERAELERRVRGLRGTAERIPVDGRTAVLVDDGIATGATARAACEVVRAAGAGRVVVASPVAPPETVRELRGVADDVVCVQQPPYFGAVGQWYADFVQVSDAEVADLLARAGFR